ncbi:ESCRT-II complex subunit domain-containing protein [Trichoderma austrokoningii]
MASTTTSEGFPFPREYFFPAFFTRQPNLTIHHAQLTKWSSLVLAYARHHRMFRLALSAAAESDLFYNRGIDRRLAPADIREVVDFMRKDGRAEYLQPGDFGANSSGSGSGNSDGDASSAAAAVASTAAGAGAGDVVLIYWRKPQEWAALIEAYVDETAQKGSVLTVYELTEGENTRGTEFHGMDNGVLMKALHILVKRGKAQIFGSEDSLGVKFF